MKRLVCLLGMSLLTTAWAAPCAHADAPTNAAGSDLGDKARLLQLPDPSADPSAELRQLHTEAVVLSAVIRNKLALERTSNSAADRARLTQEISDLNRRLADDRLRALLEAALLKRQRDIRAGKAFPGTEITLL